MEWAEKEQNEKVCAWDTGAPHVMNVFFSDFKLY